MFKQSLRLRIKKQWLDHEWIGALLVFSLASAMYTYWTAAPNFADPDSFYHLKIAELMMQQRGPITEFIWLPYTTLANAYVDHHMLYHAFLIPWIALFGSFVGMKAATVFLAAAAITVLYLILRTHHVRYASFFTLLVLFSYDFSFRMGLAKAPSVAFLFLMTSVYLMSTHRFRWLIILSFFFVWSYGGFVLLPIIAGVYSIVSVVRSFWQPTQSVSLFSRIKTHFLPFAATLSGTLAGLLIHPSFPQHIQLYWEQIVLIGAVNYSSSIGVGNEWYPLAITELLLSPILLTLLVSTSSIIHLVTVKKLSVLSITAGIMTLTFFIITLKSQRYIEYYIPWGYLFSALTLFYSGVLDALPRLYARVRAFSNPYPLHIVSFALMAFCVAGTLISLKITEATQLHTELQDGRSIHSLTQSTNWLATHSTKGDIIFHDDWDEFPILFYKLQRGRYIAGLDPTFLYLANQELYWKWVNITTGKQSDQLYETISGDFKARFVFIEKDHHAMLDTISADARFKQVYEDDEAVIFRIPRKE